jgi:hypothetical protein
MTQTLARPSRPVAGRRRTADRVEGGARSSVLTGALAAAAAALAGLAAVGLPVLLVWWAEERSRVAFVDALATGAQAWLVAHGASLDLPEGTLGLTPLALVAVPAVVLWRAGRRTAEALGARTVRGALQAAAAVAVPYAAVTGVVAAAAQGDAVRPGAFGSLVHALALALVAAGAGAVRAADAAPLLRARTPPRVRALGLASAAALLSLLAVSALLVAVSLGRGFAEARELAATTSPGVVGGFGVLSLGLSLAPNAVAWAAAWLAGPGFAVGTGTAVSPGEVVLGPLPALPLTAALPSGAHPAAWLVLLVPVLAGVLAGLVLVRRRCDAGVLDALAVAAAGGLALAVLAWMSGGPVGGERLAELGPSPVPVGAAFAVAVAVGAVGVVLRHRRAVSR